MYGKILRVSEYELKFGAKEKSVNVFVCFKYKGNGNNYVIYSYVGEEITGKVYYGFLHIGQQKLISMEPKEGDSEIIKDITWKLLNNVELNDYEILEIGEISKIEIISNNYLDMKPKVVKSLIDLTIPKKEEIIKEMPKKKKNSIINIFIVILILVLGCGGYYFYANMGKFLGYGTFLECTYEEVNIKLDANILRKITAYYDRNDNYEKLVDNTAYIFNEYEDYYEFKEKGEFLKYNPSKDFDSGYNFDDKNLTFRTIVNANNDKIYYIEDIALPGNKNKDLEQFNKKGYICVSQNREE